MLRHIQRPFLRAQAAFSSAKAAETRPAIGNNDDRTRKWLQRLGNLTTTPASKGNIGQLTTVVNLLNRKAQDMAPSIDWKTWSDKIITPGLVDKVKNNHDELQKQEYEIDRIADNIFKNESKPLEQIGREMSFHTAIWIDNYSDYVEFLLALEEFSGTNDYMLHELADIFYGIETLAEEQAETHNYIAGSKDDINLWGYMAAQFQWGKKVITFYRHPADDFKCLKATKNVMGR